MEINQRSTTAVSWGYKIRCGMFKADISSKTVTSKVLLISFLVVANLSTRYAYIPNLSLQSLT